MNRLAQQAVLIGLARRLFEHGSWSGETHIQKAAYLVHEAVGVPFDFDFILYKHGPFSFELREELGSMRVDRLLEREPQPPPYGPRIVVTDRGQELEERFGRKMEQYSRALDWVTDRLRDRGVVELERLATAMWVTKEMLPSESVEDRAIAVTKIKPHVHRDDAERAVAEVDEMLAEASLSAA